MLHKIMKNSFLVLLVICTVFAILGFYGERRFNMKRSLLHYYRITSGKNTGTMRHDEGRIVSTAYHGNQKKVKGILQPPINISTRIGCHETSNFVFIKTHKTGSTTLRSLTCRFGYFRNLSFLLGKGGVIGHLNNQAVKWSPNSSNLLPPIGVSPSDHANHRNYNISNIHWLFRRDIVRKLMYPASDLKYFTIIREPTEQWLSQFQYFKDYKRLGLKLETLSNTLLPFLLNLTEQPRKPSFNKQLRDLGVPSSVHKNATKLNEALSNIDKEFDLVLITEYFDESLILLKKLLCWRFEDILYVKKRQQPNPLTVDETTRREIRKYNSGDVTLYHYFLAVFWRKVKEYGPVFEEDLRTFRKLLNDTWNICIGNSVTEVSPDRYLYVETYLAQNSSEFCWALVNTKFQMDIEIVKRQGHTSDKRWAAFV